MPRAYPPFGVIILRSDTKVNHVDHGYHLAEVYLPRLALESVITNLVPRDRAEGLTDLAEGRASRAGGGAGGRGNGSSRAGQGRAGNRNRNRSRKQACSMTWLIGVVRPAGGLPPRGVRHVWSFLSARVIYTARVYCRIVLSDCLPKPPPTTARCTRRRPMWREGRRLADQDEPQGVVFSLNESHDVDVIIIHGAGQRRAAAVAVSLALAWLSLTTGKQCLEPPASRLCLGIARQVLGQADDSRSQVAQARCTYGRASSDTATPRGECRWALIDDRVQFCPTGSSSGSKRTRLRRLPWADW